MWFATAKRPRARLPRRGTVLGGHAPDSGVVSALSGQHIGLRSHNEVVAVEAADLVGPPSHCDAPPLGEEGGMVTLRLGEAADPVGEGQRVSEAWKGEDSLEAGDPVALQHMPARDLTSQLRDLRL